MQTILSRGRLLNQSGNLEEAGYATSLVKEYRREDIKANPLRIKEWDYYYIGNDRFGVALTIADNSYMGLGSVSFLNFKTGYWKTKSVMTILPLGKTCLPETSEAGDVSFQHQNLDLRFENDGFTRRLQCQMRSFEKSADFSCDIVLSDPPRDSMVIATPFSKKKHFYYNQKINCLTATGFVRIGDVEYLFNKGSFGVLDWGRGVWTYHNTWNWASMSSLVNGKKIGFNFGYGFGDTSQATENMLFYDGYATKLNQVEFSIPVDSNQKPEYLKPWNITSDDGRVNLIFTPIIDRHDNMNLGILKSVQHQVFGKFSGTLKTDHEELTIKDLMGFAERVSNKW